MSSCNVKFNVNNYVKVKLTEYGISILKKDLEQLNKVIMSHGGIGLGDFKVNVDGDGYTQFQMWSLMLHFGHVMNIGGRLPFETEIILMDAELKEIAKE